MKVSALSKQSGTASRNLQPKKLCHVDIFFSSRPRAWRVNEMYAVVALSHVLDEENVILSYVLDEGNVILSYVHNKGNVILSYVLDEENVILSHVLDEGNVILS